MNYGADGVLASKFLSALSKVNWERASAAVEKAAPVAQSVLVNRFNRNYAPAESEEPYVPVTSVAPASTAPTSTTPAWVWPTVGIVGLLSFAVILSARKR